MSLENDVFRAWPSPREKVRGRDHWKIFLSRIIPEKVGISDKPTSASSVQYPASPSLLGDVSRIPCHVPYVKDQPAARRRPPSPPLHPEPYSALTLDCGLWTLAALSTIHNQLSTGRGGGFGKPLGWEGSLREPPAASVDYKISTRRPYHSGN